MPGLMRRKLSGIEGLKYDESSDKLYIQRGYRGVRAIAGVREVVSDPDIVHLNDIQATDSVELSGDSLIKGNILSQYISVRAREPSVVIGDLGAISEEGGSITVEGQSLIMGNLISKSVLLKDAIVVGQVLGIEEVQLESSVVLGRVMAGIEAEGKVKATDSTFFQVYSRGDIELMGRCTTLLPIVVSKGGRIEVEAEGGRIRVIGMQCMMCSAGEPFRCPYYIEGSCDNGKEDRFKGRGPYDYLANYDAGAGQGFKYISWFWRSSPLMILQNLIIAKKILYSALSKSRSTKVDDLSRKIINNMSLKQFYDGFLPGIVMETLGEVGKDSGRIRELLTETIVKYFEGRDIKYRICPHCGGPNSVDGKVCVFCGESLLGTDTQGRNQT